MTTTSNHSADRDTADRDTATRDGVPAVDDTTRVEATVAAASWIPSHGVPGVLRLPFDVGMTHYDSPLPRRISPGDVATLIDHDACRSVNVLSAWIVVDASGRIVDHGRGGGGRVCSTTVGLGPIEVTRPGKAAPDLRPTAEVHPDRVVFTQTTGGRTWVPAPRLLRRAPFVGLQAPPIWTTLQLTLHADGRVEHELVGASPFPRHWVYGPDGELSTKSGVLGFRHWYRRVGGRACPWGARDLDVATTPIETDLEREVADRRMRADGPLRVGRRRAGQVLARQGDADRTMWLVLDGLLHVEVDGSTVGAVGPGWVVGERASTGDGVRTATLRAVTPVRVVEVHHDVVRPEELARIAHTHAREELVHG